MKLPIYLDYAATTPVDPRVVAKMQACLSLDGYFGNPASEAHSYGQEAKKLITIARAQVADLINAETEEIIWTSGATEAINLALKGAAFFNRERGKHIVTCKTEHKAVLDTCQYLAKCGFTITYLTPQANGLLAMEDITQALRPDTILVSLMHVNNEMGVIQDIAKIGELTRTKNILFHVDAAQSAGKIPIDVKQMKIDLMSLSAHKTYGPKGIGALYVCDKPKVRLEPLIHGGGHERGMRSGTLATQQIVGMGAAFAIAQMEMTAENTRISYLRDKLWRGLQTIPGIVLNGDLQQRVANNLNFSVAGVDGEALIMALRDLAISTGSACTSAMIEPSHVLSALGISKELAHSSIRISLGRFTTEAEVEYALAHIQKGICWLRSFSPLWSTEENNRVSV